ncbi:putative aspergillopepsin [Pseudovirgaria hyperparasitica]|uniref:Putative aspergillopepsin n=1 Tax=Pseudovirgaria hyperparasitica TaxID=470096 RepID=A0A6A6WB12_9PEZI|nr:putative aspergillopepsin [Pseudovirgaria hyperparasitica]KAF2759369.1 putative aspergillopepsin [Pseudovirgaria hyperparasitica]
MKLSTPLTTILCTVPAFAAPFTSQRRDRHLKRAAQRQSNPPIPVVETTLDSTHVGIPVNTTHAEYSTNWAGAVLIGTGYKSVTGTIVVPTPSIPSGGSSKTEYAASAWVGIDGDTCSTSILQTGVDFYVQGSTVSFDAWYEWYPDYAYNFASIPISAGNTITMTVTASSVSGGSATVTNESTGKTVTHTFTAQSAHLCETNAEWIVEDFSSSGGLVPFADFGKVEFTGASASTGSATVGVTGASILDIKQSGTVLTSCAVSGSSGVVCDYV